jgi:O-6-methylguanine DNA methyltransferase
MRVDLQCAHSVSDQQSQMLLVIEQRLRCGDDITDLPLDVRGTPFQLLVWSYLRTIKYGHTATYAKVADAIGRPRAIRAVAQACACNKVALAIPCHRVVRSDGALGGYRWGLTLKQHILSAESHNL